jgi:tRNA A-37 threonylcarbamoyl transferase component Bud32
VGALFDRALSTPPPERALLVRASGEPIDVQEEVLSLLQSHDASDGFLEPPALLQPGAHVGQYRIERILGRGGMGVVYLARDTRLHRHVALKSLPPHLFRDPRMHARLKQEARAAAALSHPSIATVYALEEVGDQIFIASEYLEGRTLRDELDIGPIEPGRALVIATEVARALTAAHERGIVHRDLKPENIVLTATGGVKVVDFGLAQFDLSAEDLASVTRLTDPGTMAGTPPYMAPEQLLGNPTSARTDQFAFGVTLYEMLTGRHPFGSGPLPTTIARVLSGELQQGEIPDAPWTVIARATQKQPENRFANMAELLTELGTGHPPLGTRHPPTLARELASYGETAPKRPAAAKAGQAPGTDAGATRSWWEIHQLIVALSYWAMVYPAWHVHKWLGQYGVLVFLATLAIVIVGGNLRLHLWFTSRTFPSELGEQRAHVAQWVRAADILFSVIMLTTGLAIAGDHTAWGALFISFGIGAALAFAIIEPTTARAAFKRG